MMIVKFLTPKYSALGFQKSWIICRFSLLLRMKCYSPSMLVQRELGGFKAVSRQISSLFGWWVIWGIVRGTQS